MEFVYQKVKAFIADEAGATALEYALLVSGIALAIYLGVTAFGTALNSKFNNLSTNNIVQ
jgi:pilus assembly protein Flp/PilA